MAYDPVIGSVVAFQSNPANLQVTASVAGAVSVTNPPSSVIALQGPGWSGSVAAAITNIPTVIVGGSVVTIGTAAPNQSVSGTVGASIIGLAPVSVSNFPTTQNVSGSVVSFPGAGWPGSVVAFQGGTQITSIAGGYATGATSVISALGVQILGVRNDTMASVFGGDGTYSPLSVGPIGETIVANAPLNKWVQGDTSIFAIGPSVSVLSGQTAGIYNYMTSAQISNFGATSVLGAWLSQTGATSASIIGHFFAPASGGSNMLFPNAIKTGAGAALAASISGAANVYISAQGFISKT